MAFIVIITIIIMPKRPKYEFRETQTGTVFIFNHFNEFSHNKFIFDIHKKLIKQYLMNR